jgi:hypothetical protein
MHLFSPDRPRLTPDGSPLLIAPDGTKTHVVPSFYIKPLSETEIEISVFLARAPNCASRRAITLPLAELGAFYAEWLADPEAAAHRHFAWVWEGSFARALPSTPKAPKPSGIATLDDLI